MTKNKNIIRIDTLQLQQYVLIINQILTYLIGNMYAIFIKIPTILFSDEETIQYRFMSLIKYKVYKSRYRCIIHV